MNTRDLRVLVLSPYSSVGPSARYRVFAFKESLKQRGIDLDIRPFLTAPAFARRMSGRPHHPLVLGRVVVAAAERVLQVLTAKRRYDLIYVHRQTAPVIRRVFDTLFLKSGVPIIFDMDDAVFTEYSIVSLLRGSRAATVGNDYLADYVRRTSPGTRVIVMPTVVDTSYYTPLSDENTALVVGWIGTASTFYRYFLPELSALVQVCRAHGAEFHVVASANVKKDVEQAGATFILWTLATEAADLQRFDIGVMPLLDDDYVRGKCAFKLIQYGAVGIPGIGTNIGANSEVIQDGVNGFLTETSGEMASRLQQLLTDTALRQRMGAAARDMVERRFSLSAQVEVLEQVFRTAAAQGG
jgi:glycosyltransferase involved in cell wall biosynthesis